MSDEKDLIINALVEKIGQLGAGIPFALTRLTMEKAPDTYVAWNEGNDRALVGQEPRKWTPPKFGAPVRTKCTATGRYMGHYGGRHLALFMSAINNELHVDVVDRDGIAPAGGHPLPSDEALAGACAGYRAS